LPFCFLERREMKYRLTKRDKEELNNYLKDVGFSYQERIEEEFEKKILDIVWNFIGSFEIKKAERLEERFEMIKEAVKDYFYENIICTG